MARPRKTDPLDLSQPVELTLGLIERLTCPPGKAQAFLRDTKAPGLRVRVTAGGAKAFVFEAKVAGRTLRRTIGDARTGDIAHARAEANRLRVTCDDGIDPREVERKAREEKAAACATAAQHAVTVGQAWQRYLQEGRPKRREAWKPRYRADMALMASAGGLPKKRGAGVTRPGPLFPLLDRRLMDINSDVLQHWFEAEALRGRHQATRALMMFRGFLRWCAARPEYRALTDRDAGKAEAILEAMPPNIKRTDALEAAQLPGWWSAVAALRSPVASVYLRGLLLTGARREELAALKWADVDFRWRKMTLADKVGDFRTIPLGDCLAELLMTLPRKNQFVFPSDGSSGRLMDVRSSHVRALREAGIEALTLHGLRRSFSLFGEAAGAPAGAIAQIMGHQPSATAEGYRPRSIDALRPFLARIESYITGVAGAEPPAQHSERLRIVAGHG